MQMPNGSSDISFACLSPARQRKKRKKLRDFGPRSRPRAKKGISIGSVNRGDAMLQIQSARNTALSILAVSRSDGTRRLESRGGSEPPGNQAEPSQGTKSAANRITRGAAAAGCARIPRAPGHFSRSTARARRAGQDGSRCRYGARPTIYLGGRLARANAPPRRKEDKSINSEAAPAVKNGSIATRTVRGAMCSRRVAGATTLAQCGGTRRYILEDCFLSSGSHIRHGAPAPSGARPDVHHARLTLESSEELPANQLPSLPAAPRLMSGISLRSPKEPSPGRPSALGSRASP